jgi:hypothetical protein
MGKVKRLELWWQLYLYVTSGSGLRKKPALTLCAFECTRVFEIRNGIAGETKVVTMNTLPVRTYTCTSSSLELRWSRGCVLASSIQVREFKPGRSGRIFQGEKIPSTPSFGGEVKPAVKYRRFAACKRSLNVTWKSAFRQNFLLLFLAH